MRKWLRWGGIGCGGALAAVAALILAGFLLPGEIALSTEREIDAPAEVLFELFDTQDGLRRWWGSFADETEAMGYPPMELSGLEGPDRGEGMRFQFAMGDTVTEVWTVLESTPGERVVYDVDFQVMRVERTITLEPVDADTTRVRWSETGTIGNPVMRWFAWLEGDGIVDNFEKALDGAEEVAEATPAAPAVPPEATPAPMTGEAPAAAEPISP